jgi:putative endonuclease
LVYVEAHATVPLAIVREKRLKTWNRAWKVRLINKDNPDWEDLFERILW